MRRVTYVLCAVAGLWPLLLFAQEPTATPDQPPVVSEVFTLRKENLALKQQLELLGAQLTVCQGKLAPAVYQESMGALEQERLKLLEDFEKANPGWTLDLKTGAAVKKQDEKKGGGQ